MHTILVIEDNSDLGENTIEMLEMAGYRVIHANNGQTGCEMALQHRPDAVLCDMLMPGLDGYGVLSNLKGVTETADIPFIVFSAMTERKDIERVLKMGADAYITKPFDEDKFLKQIAFHLEKGKSS